MRKFDRTTSSLRGARGMRGHSIHFLALLPVLACREADHGEAPGIIATDVDASVITDPCTLLSGAVFESVPEIDMGLGPNGPVMGHHFLELRNGMVRWGVADFSLSDRYECLDGELWRGNQKVPYDPKREILTWNGIEYSRVR